MNPILAKQIDADIQVNALSAYLEDQNSSLDDFLNKLPQMSDEDISEFLDGFNTYYQEMKNVVIQDALKQQI